MSALDIQITGGGEPTPEQIAAIVGVLLSRGGAPTPDDTRPSAWNAPAALHRRPLPPPGPGAWTLSLR